MKSPLAVTGVEYVDNIALDSDNEAAVNAVMLALLLLIQFALLLFNVVYELDQLALLELVVVYALDQLALLALMVVKRASTRALV